MSLTIPYIIKKYGSDTTAIKSINESKKDFAKIDDIGGCKNLLRLDLSKNRIDAFGGCINCYSLTFLNLSNNLITEIPKDISLLKGLITLNISYNQISDLGPLSALESLKSLIATGNQIKTTKPLRKLTLLNTLILSKNEINDVSGLEKLILLNKLSLSHNKLTEFSPHHGMSILTELRLNENKLLKITLPFPKLKLLDIGNNPIVKKKELLNTLGESKRLENLNVKGCPNLGEEEVKAACPKLTVFNNQPVQWRDEYFEQIRQQNLKKGVVSKKKHVCKVQKLPSTKKNKRAKTSEGTIEGNQIGTGVGAAVGTRKGVEETKGDDGKVTNSGENKQKDDSKAPQGVDLDTINHKNVTGIKKVKRKAKEENKGTFKEKSKEEKLKLLAKLHPY